MKATGTFSFLFLAAALWILGGCSAGVKVTKAPDFDEKAVRLIAVMPIPPEGCDDAVSAVVRELILDELYFKGYPKIPLSMVDQRLNGTGGGQESGDKGTVPPEAAGPLIGADAVLYSTIEKRSGTSLLFYAPTTVRVSMVLRSTHTGEELWQGGCEIVRRICGFPKSSLEVKSVIAADEALREAVKTTISRLPDGPDGVGTALPKKGFFERWWPFGSS